LLFRFNAPIVFFNAPYFKRTLLSAVTAAGPNLNLVVVDLLPVTCIDATGPYTTQEVAAELESRGVKLAAAGRRTEWDLWATSRKIDAKLRNTKIYPTMRAAIKAYLATHGAVEDGILDREV
jgi:MFS superfamily sulfate permease-like transporter